METWGNNVAGLYDYFVLGGSLLKQAALSDREVADSQVRMSATRGSGTFIGAFEEFSPANGTGTGWSFNLRAKGEVSAKLLSFSKFYELVAKHPQFEADGRAGKPSMLDATFHIIAFECSFHKYKALGAISCMKVSIV